MDPVSHAALGATLAAVAAPPHQRRLALLIGATAALLPDADALIRSDSDPLLLLDYHRHFSHALLFVPLGALIAALILWPFMRQRIGFRPVLLYSLAGISTSGLLDACTSYGTQLLLPFSNEKIAWNLISVVDPLFSVLLLVPLVRVLRQPARNSLRIGLALAGLYLGLGAWQQQRVTIYMRDVAAARGHAVQKLTVKPTLGNQLLWRSLYIHDGQVQADAIHAGWRLRHYAGQSAPLLPQADPLHAEDIERFRRFSDGWLVQSTPGFIGDARYAMLPTAIDPIWGIRWDAQGRLQFISRHEMSREQRTEWLRMFRGG